MSDLHDFEDKADAATGVTKSFDLIICRDDRIVVHDSHNTRHDRLRALVTHLKTHPRLTSEHLFETKFSLETLHNTLDATVVAEAASWRANPDQGLNQIAKLCRRWNIQVYASTPQRSTAPLNPPVQTHQLPEVLFTVITDYGHNQIVAEHFLSAEDRVDNLIARAAQLTTVAVDHLREHYDATELAGLIGYCLTPAKVSLVATRLSTDTNSYRPDCLTASVV